MNGHGNMTPSSNQYQNPFSIDSGKSTGVSPSPTSPYPRVPLTRYPAGSPHFSPGPRCTTTQPSATFSYLPLMSPSSSSFHRSLPPAYPSASSSCRGSSPSVSSSPSSVLRDSFPGFSPGPRSMTQPSPVFSSLPPSPVYTSFSPVSPGPRSVTQPSPVFSPRPPSPVYSSYPPETPSPSTARRNLLPPTYPSPSARVENRGSSIGFNKNPSALPPRVPVRRSKSMSVSGRNNTLPPRKSHKRTDSDIIGINSTIPQNPLESNYPMLSNLLVGDSSCHMEDAVDWNYNEQARKEFFDEFMIVDDNNASNGNENVDELMVTISDSDVQSNANENGFKTGPTSSGVKRKAGKDIDPLSRHYESVSMDSSFNDMLKSSPGNLPVDGTENAFSFKLGKGEYTASELKTISGSTRLAGFATDPKKIRRILSNRESAARSKQRKSQYIVDLECRVNVLENDNTSMSNKIAVLEKDKMMMKSENKEMSIRIESLEQQGQLRDEIERLKAGTASREQESVDAQQLKEAIALNERLTAEVQRLKVAAGEVMQQNDGQFDGSNMQPLDTDMFQQLNINEFNEPQPNLVFYGQF